MSLKLPSFKYRVRLFEGKQQIFDVLRKKFVCITPEEWVRQHVVHYLIDYKGFSEQLMAVERLVEVNGLKRRFDLVCYNRDGSVFMLVECKNSQIKLSQQVFDQAFCYNTELNATYVAITNGVVTLCGKTADLATILSDFPMFE